MGKVKTVPVSVLIGGIVALFLTVIFLFCMQKRIQSQGIPTRHQAPTTTEPTTDTDLDWDAVMKDFKRKMQSEGPQPVDQEVDGKPESEKPPTSNENEWESSNIGGGLLLQYFFKIV